MNERSKINFLRIGSLIVLVLIMLLISKCVDYNKKLFQEAVPTVITSCVFPEDTVKFVPIETDTLRYSNKPKVVYVKNKIDTLGILKYCIDNNLYSDLFPIKKVPEIKTVRDTVYLEAEPVAPEKDTVYNTTIVKVPCSPVININKTEDRIHPFIGIGADTFPSASVMAGVMFKNNWGFAIEATHYFYHGTIKNATIPDNVNVIVETKSVSANNAPPVGYVEIPTFSIGAKVIRRF